MSLLEPRPPFRTAKPPKITNKCSKRNRGSQVKYVHDTYLIILNNWSSSGSHLRSSIISTGPNVIV